MDILEWIRMEKGIEFLSANREVCLIAARVAQIDVLQWARMNGCPWGANTCSTAALAGHLEVLQ